ncbi:O-methyltransferase [Vicingaceae bacterium]|mgnify:FL=1|nr:O-methyltransferase [Vicingaceae bacterium]MDB9963666.1 O-methyltransferase [Vicingaceae bacterium]
MNFLDEKLEEYVIEHTSKEDELLYELHRETYLKVLQPRMLSGHFQGRVLSMISKMIRPSRILELGTYTGYSALCLAEGLTKNGHLHTIDKNEERQDFVQSFIDRSNFAQQITQHIGNAMEVIPQLNESWDLVFIDADKENYLNYYNLVLPTLKSGSYILADNILWSGKVVDKSALDKDTNLLREFNKQITQDPRIENILLPIRDGIQIGRVI